MYSAGNTRALPRVGFPIRRSRDQRLVSTSPALIAAAHVLHRLLAPRHPPYALVLLIEKNTLCAAMEFSRCESSAPKPDLSLARDLRKSPRGRSLKTQQHAVEVDILLGELVFRTAEAINGRVATGVIAPESLERR